MFIYICTVSLETNCNIHSADVLLMPLLSRLDMVQKSHSYKAGFLG